MPPPPETPRTTPPPSTDPLCQRLADELPKLESSDDQGGAFQRIRAEYEQLKNSLTPEQLMAAHRMLEKRRRISENALGDTMRQNLDALMRDVGSELLRREQAEEKPDEEDDFFTAYVKKPFTKFFTGAIAMLPEPVRKFFGKAEDAARNVLSAVKRLFYGFLAKLDTHVPAWAVPMLQSHIDNAKEYLVILDAKDGLRDGVRKINDALKKKGQGVIRVAWDEIAWVAWRPKVEALRGTRPVGLFVREHVIQHLTQREVAAGKTLTIPMKSVVDAMMEPAPLPLSTTPAPPR